MFGKPIADSLINSLKSKKNGPQRLEDAANAMATGLTAVEALKKTFGKDPIPTRSGGSIPIIALFEEVLGIKSVLMGFGLDSDALHSPNEHFGLFNFYKGIETIPYYYQYYSQLKK